MRSNKTKRRPRLWSSSTQAAGCGLPARTVHVAYLRLHTLVLSRIRVVHRRQRVHASWLHPHGEVSRGEG